MKHLSLLAMGMIFAISAAGASAQGNGPTPAAPPGAGSIGGMPMQHQAGMHDDTGGPAMMHGAGQPAGMPTEAGQAAFGAIQEIVRMLLADPMTNWSRVDIDALRQHLVDMDELTLHADAKKEPIENGLRILVTGKGRTLEAIRRMVPAHAQDINGPVRLIGADERGSRRRRTDCHRQRRSR